ncbi:MAG: outer membrane beta-barrel protein [Bacteroidota bacterium]|jgi:hypothetical protein
MVSFQSKIFFILIFLSSHFFFAQEKTANEKKKSPFDLSNYKAEPKDKLLLEFMHCGWMNLPKGVKSDWYSRGVNFHLFFDVPFGKSNFSVAFGGGLSSHNVSGNMKFLSLHDSLGGGVNLVSRGESYKKNVFGAKILEVPLEIRFRTRKARSFKLAAGFKVGYTVQNFNKIFDSGGKRKIFDLDGYNPLRYGALLRIGYEEIYLSCFYSFSSVLMKNGNSGEIFPYTVGIGITPW